MDLEKELSELVIQTQRSEDRIRDLFRFCCPPSLRQACQEFCHTLSYGGTIFPDDEKRIRQDLDWNGYMQVCVVGNYDITPMYIFHIRYFGGNFAFASRFAHGGYGLFRQDSNGWWYTTQGHTTGEKELRQCAVSLEAATVSRFLQEGLSVCKRAEADLLQFMREKVKGCGEDIEHLFYQTHHWLSSQKEFLACSDAFRKKRDLLEKRMLHVQCELREIVAGIGASKSFAKSKALKALRERGEKLLDEFVAV